MLYKFCSEHQTVSLGFIVHDSSWQLWEESFPSTHWRFIGFVGYRFRFGSEYPEACIHTHTPREGGRGTDAQIVKKSRSHLKVLGARRVTWSRFHDGDGSQILGATAFVRACLSRWFVSLANERWRCLEAKVKLTRPCYESPGGRTGPALLFL